MSIHIHLTQTHYDGAAVISDLVLGRAEPTFHGPLTRSLYVSLQLRSTFTNVTLPSVAPSIRLRIVRHSRHAVTSKPRDKTVQPWPRLLCNQQPFFAFPRSTVVACRCNTDDFSKMMACGEAGRVSRGQDATVRYPSRAMVPIAHRNGCCVHQKRCTSPTRHKTLRTMFLGMRSFFRGCTTR